VPYPIDSDGFPYRIDDLLGPARMTHCCGAATCCDDTGFYCKSCVLPLQPTRFLPVPPQRRHAMNQASEHPADLIDPDRDHAPRPWDLFDAQHTTTPHAAYGTADPGCTRHGCCYFASDANRDQWIAELRTNNPRQTFYRWDLDRSTGQWTARSPIEPDQDGPAMTDVLATLAQCIVDGHPEGSATLGQLTLTVHVNPDTDTDTDPAADNHDAYTYTREAVAAFRRGDWSFTTVTLHIYIHGVRARATQHGVDHGLAAPDDEREQLAGSLLPDLLAEAAGNLCVATAAVGNQTGTDPQEPAGQQRSVPATLTEDNYPVVAWIPAFRTDDSAIAVGYRPEPEHDHAPYVVWTVQAQPSEPGRYRVVDGSYDVEDLGEAMLEAIALAEREDTRAAQEYDQRDGSSS